VGRRWSGYADGGRKRWGKVERRNANDFPKLGTERLYGGKKATEEKTRRKTGGQRCAISADKEGA